MIEHYPTIKLLHMSCAWLSLSGFILRATWALRDSPLLRHRLARIIPISIDSVLLGSALTLAGLSGQWPQQQPWLSAKLVALLVYIGLGMVALHWGRQRAQRAVAAALAVAVFAYMLAVASTRSVLPGVA